MLNQLKISVHGYFDWQNGVKIGARYSNLVFVCALNEDHQNADKGNTQKNI